MIDKNSWIINLLFVVFQTVFDIKVQANTFAAFEIITSFLIQKDLAFANLGISSESFREFSRRRTRCEKQVQKRLSSDMKFEVFGEPKTFAQIREKFIELIVPDKPIYEAILKEEIVQRRIHAYNSMQFNDVWCFDFTTLEMLVLCPKTELLIIMDLSSRKVVGWKLFESKEGTNCSAIIECFEDAFAQHGASRMLHSDSDMKNHSDEFNSWAKRKHNISVSITTDLFSNKHFPHGNQVVERFNRTLKHYFFKLDGTKSFLNFEFSQLHDFIKATITFYNNKAHSTLSSRDRLISPEQAFFNDAIFDALKSAWNDLKERNANQQSPVPAPFKDTKALSIFISNKPEFIKSVEQASVSNPSSIQDIFNQFLELIAPTVYESSDPFVKHFFDNAIPSRVKGPGRENKPGPLFDEVKKSKSSFATGTAFILKLFSLVMTKVLEIQTKIIITNNEEVGNRVISSLTEEINKSKVVIEDMSDRIKYLETIQRQAVDIENQKAALREKRKNRTLQKQRSAIQLNEFIFALQNVKSDPKREASRFAAARDRIALFILYFSGLRVGNLLLMSIQEVERFFIHGNEKTTPVVLIKKRKKIESQELVLSKAVVNQFVFGEYKLIDDFETVKNVIVNAHLNVSPDPKPYPFYTSFKDPLKAVSREALTKNINTILKSIPPDEKNVKRLLSSHSFRINVLTKIIQYRGYSVAQKFAHHTDIKSTAAYDRNVFDTKITKEITGILADTRTGKKALSFSKSLEEFEQEAIALSLEIDSN